ncbi:MAG TPA: hypothetical protein VK973_10310, partial [Arenicellales bacterium]|nr:hypothetical protein [Arenicellales bacterium]
MTRSAQRPLAGLVCALPLESRPARRHAQLAVRVCEVSAPALLDAIEELRRGGSRLIVSWGTAGALSPRLRAGELVVPARVVSGDGRALSTDAGCRAGLLRSLRGRPAVHGGALLESRSVLAAPADKQRAGRDHAADAVDMESHRIGDACAALGMPFLVVRAIVDELDDRLPRSVTAAFRAG